MNDIFDTAELDKLTKPETATPKPVADGFNSADLDKIKRPVKKMSLTRPKTDTGSTNPTPQRSLNQDEIEVALKKAGWGDDKIPIMSAIAMGEGAVDPKDPTRRMINSFNPGIGPGGKPTKEKSYGLLQINMIDPQRQRKYDIDRLAKDPVYNLEVARDIYENQPRKGGDQFTHWGAYSNGSYRKHLRKGVNNSGSTDWTPSAYTPSGAPAVDFKVGDPLPSDFSYTAEQKANFEKFKNNQPIATQNPKNPSNIPQQSEQTDVLTDSAGNQYFSASQDGVPEGWTRVKSTNLRTNEEMTFLIDKDKRIFPEIKPGVPMNPNSRYDTNGNEYSLSSDQNNIADGSQRFERTDETGKKLTFLFGKDGSIKQEGVSAVPDWLLGKTPARTPLPNDKTLQIVHQRLLKAGAKDSEEMRQRLIQGYNDKMSGKSPTMFTQDEINLMEDLQTKTDIAAAEGQPTPEIQPQGQQNLRQAPNTINPQSLKAPANKVGFYKIPVDVTGYSGYEANRKAAEQGISQSGVVSRGKKYDAIETQALVDREEKLNQGRPATAWDSSNKPTGKAVQYDGKGTYGVSAQNMADNEAYLNIPEVKKEIERIRSQAMYKFIASTQEVTDENIQNLRDLGYSDEDIRAAVYGENPDNPKNELFRWARDAREQNKITLEKNTAKYMQGDGNNPGDSPFVAGLKAYRDIGVITDEEVQRAVQNQARLREIFRHDGQYENKRVADQLWDDMSRGFSIYADYVNPFSAYQDYQSNTDFGDKTRAAIAALRSQEVEDFIREKEMRHGSLEKYQIFLDMNKDQEYNVWRQAKQFLRSVANLGTSAIKSVGVADAALESVNPLSYLLPEDYMVSLRTVFNWAGWMGNKFAGNNRPWVSAADSGAANPLIQIGNELQQMIGEDEYLQDSLSGKINSALASGLTFLAGGYALKGVKYGAGILGMLTQVGSTYDDLRKRGMSADEAKYWALGIGLPVGFSEQWGLGGAGERALARLGSELTDSQFKILARSMWQFAKQTNRIGKDELLEEFLQEWGQNTFGNSAIAAVTAKDKTAGQKIQQFFAEIPKQAGSSLGEATIAGLSGYILGAGTNLITTGVNYSREKAAILEDEANRGINIALWNNNLKIDGKNFPITEEIKPIANDFLQTRKEIVDLRRETYEMLEQSKEGKEIDDLELFAKIERIAELSTQQQDLAKQIAQAAGFDVAPPKTETSSEIPDVNFAPGNENPPDTEDWLNPTDGQRQVGMDLGEDINAVPAHLESLKGKLVITTTGYEGTLEGFHNGLAVVRYTDEHGTTRQSGFDLEKVHYQGEPLDTIKPEQPTTPQKPVLRDITGEDVRLADGSEGRFVEFKNGKAIVDFNKSDHNGTVIYRNRKAFDLDKIHFQGTPLSEFTINEEKPKPTTKPSEPKTYWMVNEKTGERHEVTEETVGTDRFRWKTFNKDGEPQGGGSGSQIPTGWVRESEKSSAPEFQERPPIDVSEAEQRRKDEKFTQDGVTYTRQKATVTQKAPTGKSGKVKFSNDESVDFTYALIPRQNLQPADLGGNPNFNHFIPEAQPKDRSGKASKKASDNIAKNIDLNEVGENPLAYSGAPSVNERGEVIQGNNRAEGIIKSYGLNTSYFEQLKANAEKFGFTAQQVADMKDQEPVLVRVVKASDEDAIRLGNYTQNDIETGKGIRLNPVATANRISYADQMAMIREVFREVDPGTSLVQALRSNSDRIFNQLKKHLTDEQFNSLFKENTSDFTSEGLKDVTDLFTQFLFSKGSPDLADALETLPRITQDSIIGAIPVIFSVPQQDTLVPEIQMAIMAAHRFVDQEAEDFELWKRQADMLADNRAPIDVFTPIELALAKLFLQAKKLADVRQKLADYALAINGENNMFGQVEGLSKADAIEKTFGVEYVEAPTLNYEQNEAEQNIEKLHEETNDQSDGLGQQTSEVTEKGKTAAEEQNQPSQQEVISENQQESGQSERLPARVQTSESGSGVQLKFSDLQKGMKVTLSEDLDYLKAGETYEIIDTLKKQVYFRNISTGGKTFVRNGVIHNAIQNGLLTIAQETPTVDEPAHDAATSPNNDLPEPTAAQIEAGNYKKGHVVINGLDVSIENPVGSTRSGVDEDGESWNVTMKSHYGYIKRSTGADGEHIDVYLKEGTPTDFNGEVFVVNQVNQNGEFDEHKAMVGYSSEKEARDAYLENYTDDWKGLGSITTMSFEDFRDWTKSEPSNAAEAAPTIKTPNTRIEWSNVRGWINGLRELQSRHVSGENGAKVKKHWLELANNLDVIRNETNNQILTELKAIVDAESRSNPLFEKNERTLIYDAISAAQNKPAKPDRKKSNGFYQVNGEDVTWRVEEIAGIVHKENPDISLEEAEQKALAELQDNSRRKNSEIAKAIISKPISLADAENMFDEWFNEEFGQAEDQQQPVEMDNFDKAVNKVFGQVDFTPKVDFITDEKALQKKITMDGNEVTVAEEQEKLRQQSSTLEALLNCVKTS